MAYHLSFCYTKTGKTFEQVGEFNCLNDLFGALVQIYGWSSQEPTCIAMETLHDGKCIRKIHHLNKKHKDKLIFKIKTEKKDED